MGENWQKKTAQEKYYRLLLAFKFVIVPTTKNSTTTLKDIYSHLYLSIICILKYCILNIVLKQTTKLMNHKYLKKKKRNNNNNNNIKRNTTTVTY